MSVLAQADCNYPTGGTTYNKVHPSCTGEGGPAKATPYITVGISQVVCHYARPTHAVLCCVTLRRGRPSLQSRLIVSVPGVCSLTLSQQTTRSPQRPGYASYPIVLISSAVISLRARHSIDFTHRSISREVTDHHPIAKRPYEVINLATLDLVAVILGSGPAGVWRRDARSINIKQGMS
ncbi:hypothetical protein KUCAC02_015355 [Chaenocephalus aceratus]|uniref:Uncharacterized protein n=1 Tax=Chaenocephalus aceratus TaxID=36190 RepID=A0ACB9XX23_CHAAC|nr:hypothetical protein KUCAC02_015355 [Chaenocephalus aceratus]